MNETVLVANTYKDAWQYFEALRISCNRLDATIDALIHGIDGVERKHRGGARVFPSDPTAAAAISREDAMRRFKRLEMDKAELEDFISGGMSVISGVRAALGDKYADTLEHRYIDRWVWRSIAATLGCSEPTARSNRVVAMEWIDSVGWVRAIGGFGRAEY